MGIEELGVNLFRIISTDAKLKRDKINTIRNTIRDLG